MLVVKEDRSFSISTDYGQKTIKISVSRTRYIDNRCIRCTGKQNQNLSPMRTAWSTSGQGMSIALLEKSLDNAEYAATLFEMESCNISFESFEGMAPIYFQLQSFSLKLHYTIISLSCLHS